MAAKTSAPITARVPRELAHIAPSYLDSVRQALVDMRAALDSGELDPARRKSHQMKGEGASYGFDHISELGREIQLAAEAGDERAVGDGLARLADYLERVRIEPG